jgi:hypothetical protein
LKIKDTEKAAAVASGFRPRRALGQLSVRGVAIRLFITCWPVYAAHFATNTVREIYPALSLGDHLSLDVSEYAGLHPDIFQLPDVERLSTTTRALPSWGCSPMPWPARSLM